MDTGRIPPPSIRTPPIHTANQKSRRDELFSVLNDKSNTHGQHQLIIILKIAEVKIKKLKDET